MKRLKYCIALLVLFSFSVSASEPGIWLTESEWTLIQNLWLNSGQVMMSSDETLDGLKQSQEVTESLLTDFDRLEEIDDTSLTNLEGNSDEKTDISNDLNLTSENFEATTDDLEKSFWESTGGTVVIAVGSFLAGLLTAGGIYLAVK